MNVIINDKCPYCGLPLYNQLSDNTEMHDISACERSMTGYVKSETKITGIIITKKDGSKEYLTIKEPIVIENNNDPI